MAVSVFAYLVVVLAVTASVAPAPESLLEDLHALRTALMAHGGLPGALQSRRNNPLADAADAANCSNWSYDNTTIFPNGRFRHEHTFQNDYTGFYGERFVDRPYIVHYVSGPTGDLLSNKYETCVGREWGVMECEPCEGVSAHYIFHNQPDIGCLDVPQKIQDPTVLPDGTLLEDVVGAWPTAPVEPSSTTTTTTTTAAPDAAAATTAAPSPAPSPAPAVPAFNARRLLEYYGGPPGMVTASRVRPLNATLDMDVEEEDRDEWLYDYRYTNASNALRFEHAVLRIDDSDNLYEDVRGSFYWRSAAGDFAIQYRKNQTGFTADVQPASIAIYRAIWVATSPPNKQCPDKSSSGGLLARLLG